MKRLLTYLSTILLFSLTAHAEETETSIDLNKWKWDGKVNAGFTMNTGNTENQIMTLGGAFSFDKNRWENQIDINGQITRTNSDTSTERLTVELGSRYLINDRLFAFGDMDSYYDRFDTYDIIEILSGGLGYRVVNTEKQTLDLSGGPGYRYRRLTVVPPGDKEWKHGGVAVANATYRYLFTDNSSFRQTLRMFYGQGSSNVRAQSQVNTPIVGNFGIQLSFLVDWQSNIPANSKRKKATDTTTTIALTYSFGSERK